MSKTYSIAVIAGDGIGLEVVPAAARCLKALADAHGFQIHFTEYDWGSSHYHRHGTMMPADGIAQLAEHDSIFLGAVGDPSIPDTETLWGLLIPIRREFDQYVNLRPARSLAGIPGRLASTDPIDLVIVRENTEGEYSTIGEHTGVGTADETVTQQAIFTRTGVTRVARYAADLAAQRRGLLTSATKSNGIIHTMPFWDAVVAETAGEVPGVRLESVLIDALSANLVLRPQHYDVIVASNLFGDILSDLASALTGSIGVAPSGNLNPEGRYPSMFEPVHGSAPDIAGQGVANPVGQMWAGAMMLDHLGQPEAARALESAFESCLADGVSTRDLGGSASTTEFTDEVLRRLDTR